MRDHVELVISQEELESTGAWDILVFQRVAAIEDLDNSSTGVSLHLKQLGNVGELVNPIPRVQARAICSEDVIRGLIIAGVTLDVVPNELHIVAAREVPEEFTE